MLRPFYFRDPWKSVIFALAIFSWFASAYAISSGILPGALIEGGSDNSNPKNGVVMVWILASLAAVVLLRRFNDPMAWKIPHAQAMIPAAEEMLKKYNTERRDVLLSRYDRAGELGFRGGPGSMKYDVERFAILKIEEHGRRQISEIKKMQSVRPQNKLRTHYYNIASIIDKRELVGRRVDRFLRARGLNPEEVAPSRPLSD